MMNQFVGSMFSTQKTSDTRTNAAASMILSLQGAEQSMTYLPPTLPDLPRCKIMGVKQEMTLDNEVGYK